MGKVCNYEHAGLLDGFLRRMIQNPRVIYREHVRPGMRVLDVGAGTGFTSIPFGRMVGEEGEVVAVDLQQEMLDAIRRKAVKAGLSERIILKKCGENGLGLDGMGEFDFANAFYMVHEVPNQENIFSEVYSALKSGGRFFIVEPAMHVSKGDFQRMLGIADKAGFEVMGRPRIIFSYSVVLEKR